MIHLVTRLAIVVFVALGVRAGLGQAPAGAERYPLPAPQQQYAERPVMGPGPAGQLWSAAPPTATQIPKPPLPTARAPSPPQAVLFEPGQIVARVGDKTILYGDVAPTVNMILTPVLAKARDDSDREAIEAQREMLTKNVVQQAVRNKMLLMEFERGMPGELKKDDKKRKEQEERIKKSVRTSFDESLAVAREKVANASQDDIEKLLQQDPTIMRLALLMKERQLESPGELDAALRQFGTSLEQQAKDYGEYMMGIQAVRSKLGLGSKKQKEVTHQEMLDYYEAHEADYAIPAKARFEILTVKVANFGGNRQAAWDRLAQMGNEVVVGGTPFPAVARKHSQEPRASDGGYYDWVTPGSLASKAIDRAVFSLEVDKLSQIIEDEQGFHIVHVLERKEAGQVSFLEAQPEIRKAIDDDRRAAEQQKYMADVRARTSVWTIFDPPSEVARQPMGPTQR